MRLAQVHAIALARMALVAQPRRRARRTIPRQAQPNALRLAYFHALRSVIGRAPELVQAKLVKLLPALVQLAGVVHDAPEDYPDQVTALVDEAADTWAREFPDSKLKSLAEQFADRTSRQQRQEFGKQVKAAIGIDVWAEPDMSRRLSAFASANVQLIKSVPEKYFAEVKAVTLQGLREGRRAEDLAEEIAARADVSESRAQLIARDQIGKLAGELNQARQEDLGITGYTWRTSGDERVRDEHEARDGEAFDWDDPPSDGHPGEPINCRCSAEPNLDELVEKTTA